MAGEGWWKDSSTMRPPPATCRREWAGYRGEHMRDAGRRLVCLYQVGLVRHDAAAAHHQQAH